MATNNGDNINLADQYAAIDDTIINQMQGATNGNAGADTPPANPANPVNNNTSNVDVFTNETAKALGGLVFDVKGNLINNQGKVLFTKEEALEKIKTLNSDSQQNGGNDKQGNDADQSASDYFLDENENLTDAKGNIIRKAGEYTTNDKGEIVLVDKPQVAVLAEEYAAQGFIFKDEEGKDVTFNIDSPESYKKLTEMVSTQVANQQLGKLLKTYPDAKALITHIEVGGNPVDFYRAK